MCQDSNQLMLYFLFFMIYIICIRPLLETELLEAVYEAKIKSESKLETPSKADVPCYLSTASAKIINALPDKIYIASMTRTPSITTCNFEIHN